MDPGSLIWVIPAQNSREAELVAAYLDRVGIKIELAVVDNATFRGIAQQEGGYSGMMLGNMSSAILEIDRYLQFIYTVDSIFNRSRLSDQDGQVRILQEIIFLQSVELNPDRRHGLISEIQSIVAEQTYLVSLPVGYTGYPHNSRIQGYTPTRAWDLGSVLEGVWIGEPVIEVEVRPAPTPTAVSARIIQAYGPLSRSYKYRLTTGS